MSILLIVPVWSVGKLLEWDLEKVGYHIENYRRFDLALQDLSHFQDEKTPDAIIVDCFPTHDSASEVIKAICNRPSFAHALFIGLVEKKGLIMLAHRRYVEVEKPFQVQDVSSLVVSSLKTR